MTERAESVPGSLLLEPVVLGAVALWALNDHAFKALWPGFLTGKLSDAAGLVVCPLLLLAGFELAFERAPARLHRMVLPAALLAVGCTLIGIKAFDGAAFCYQWGLAALQWPARASIAAMQDSSLPSLRPIALTRDLTDLWTLPSLIIPWSLARRHQPRSLAAR